GQKVAEFESDKSVFEYEAPCDGTVREIFCRAGDILPSGDPFLRVETADESLKHLQASASAPAQKVAVSGAAAIVREVSRTAEEPRPAKAPGRAAAQAPVKAGPQWTARAQKLVREKGLDPDAIVDIEATGPGGR